MTRGEAQALTDLRAFFWTGVRFGVVGLGSIGVYFAFLFVLRPVVPETVTLTALCYVLSTVFNYLLQSTFTFGAKASRLGSMLRYIAMHGFCIFINSGLMYVLVDLLGHPLYLIQLGVTCIVAAVSFLMSYVWVYR